MASLLRGCCVCILFFILREVSGSEYSGLISSSSRIQLDGGLRRFRRQTPQVVNQTVIDNHLYYKSNFYPSKSKQASNIWFDVASQKGSEVILDHSISGNFRVFNIMKLPFNFLFYGHTINQVAITTAGFLYTSDYFHSRIYLTQYIAPLQADFNPSLNDSSRILIYNHTERFTVQWDKVHVTNHVENGTFTFQVSLFPNGTIHFAYKEIPLRHSQIESPGHPVRVGLADSFYVDRPLRTNLILRQVYEYSSINLEEENLSYSAYVLDPVPSCVPATSCQACVEASKESPFECGWCSSLNRCSDGVDRHRQSWVDSGCADSSTLSCPTPDTQNEAEPIHQTQLPIHQTQLTITEKLRRPTPDNLKGTEKPNVGPQRHRGPSEMEGIRMFGGFFNYTNFIPQTANNPILTASPPPIPTAIPQGLIKANKPSPSPVTPTDSIISSSSVFVPSTTPNPVTKTSTPTIDTQPHSNSRVPIPIPSPPAHSVPSTASYSPISTSKLSPISKTAPIPKSIPTSEPIPAETSQSIPRTVPNSVPITTPYPVRTTKPIQIKSSEYPYTEMISEPRETIEDIIKEYVPDSYDQNKDKFIPNSENQYEGENNNKLYPNFIPKLDDQYKIDNSLLPDSKIEGNKYDLADSYPSDAEESFDDYPDSYSNNVEENIDGYADSYPEDREFYEDYYNSMTNDQGTNEYTDAVESIGSEVPIKSQEKDPDYDFTLTPPIAQLAKETNDSWVNSNYTAGSNISGLEGGNQSSQYFISGPINSSEGGNNSSKYLNSSPITITEEFSEGNGSNLSTVAARSVVEEGSSLGVAAIAGISVFVVLLLLAIGILAGTIGAVICYGYKNPNSKLGLFLIEHRPGARKLNKGAGRYEVNSEKVILDE